MSIKMEISSNIIIPGILLIGKTYGRSKSSSSKFYFKCIPHDKQLPPFLVPYEQKTIGFNKNSYNQYILFKFKEWSDKHPIGIIVDRLGPVNELNSFYEYQLHCKKLVISIKEFTKNLNFILKHAPNLSLTTNILNKYPNIENRLENSIITIDPKLSTDLDDAIGIQNNILSIYIANVPLIIEELQLWSQMSERISTIYLPNGKRTMLSPLLSDNLCSLLENEERFTFCIDIKIIDNEINISFCNALIKVRKNYDYNDQKLTTDKDYQKILEFTQILGQKYKYLKEITNSHDVVAYFMILMNVECAKKMSEFKNGIYRAVTINKIKTEVSVSAEIADFIKIWQSSSGQYCNYDNKKPHDMINNGVDYIHITSPIRRLVDLLNIIQLQQNLSLISWTPETTAFTTEWMSKLDYINTSMKAIRKVQNDCNILHLCVNKSTIMEKTYNGYVFDRQERDIYMQYTVYIPDIKVITQIKTKKELEEYSNHIFKLYLIENGLTLKRKIRAEMI
jgi:exoribonuclease R